MTEMSHPVLATKKIIIATFVALLTGAIIFITSVLPAEYGKDPTGVGKALGFIKLYQEPEQVIAQESGSQELHRLLKLEDGGSPPGVIRPEEANQPPPEKQLEERQDSIQITIPAGKGLEYKINMLKHGRLKYEWLTSQGTVYFDFHGEVKQLTPSKNVYFESYTVAYSNNMIGSFLAPFEGKHGWYFKNASGSDIRINIRLKGQYVLMN